MDAHVVYSAGEWKRVSMDNQTCDRHSSARAQARVLLPSLRELFFCGHCIATIQIEGEYTVTYETATV
jgi:hypothetical protein